MEWRSSASMEAPVQIHGSHLIYRQLPDSRGSGLLLGEAPCRRRKIPMRLVEGSVWCVLASRTLRAIRADERSGRQKIRAGHAGGVDHEEARYPDPPGCFRGGGLIGTAIGDTPLTVAIDRSCRVY